MNRLEFLDRTEGFLIQHAELYGREFFVEKKVAQRNEEIIHQNLSQFNEAIKDCQKCRLAKGRTHFVFGVGNAHARLMCIGEAPGMEEDKKGEPFVGAAGQLLDRMLAAIGFKREEVYIANVIKCRPPGNRDPEADEIAECSPYLNQQIALVQPKLLLALGRIAAQNLLGSTESLSRLRQQVHSVSGVQMIVTFHPAALLRNQQWRHDAWEDMKTLRRLYDRVVGDKPVIELDKRK